MKLYIKQRIFTWGDKFSIYDEAGNEKYYVEGEILTFGKKLHLYDLQGRELAYIDLVVSNCPLNGHSHKLQLMKVVHKANTENYRCVYSYVLQCRYVPVTNDKYANHQLKAMIMLHIHFGVNETSPS